MLGKVCGVVVIYNPDNNVKRNIESYLNKVDLLWVIDNSPNCKKKFDFSDKIIYIKFNENRGIAYALNYACQKAIKKGYEWILTMDQDSRFDMDSLNNLFKTLEKYSEINKVGIITPFHQIKGKEHVYKEKIEEKEIVMTSGNLVNLKIFNKVGGFLEKLFIDEVDHEYCYKLRKNGYKIIQVNTSKLNHELGDITVVKFFWKKKLITNHTPVRRYYMMRNRLYIIKNNPEKRKKYLKIQINELFKILFFEKQKIKKLKYMAYGICDFFQNKFGECKR